MTQVWRLLGTGPARSLTQLREQLLSERGVNAAREEDFFRPSFETSIHDPFLLHDLVAGLERIQKAKKNRERVLVWGDYDVDGITATAILVSVLTEIGVAVTPYLPNRADDGYSLNQSVLESLLPHFDLIISADCGVSSLEEIAWLKTQGKDVIVVDHHEMRDSLPEADAILHPRLGTYPFAHLSGAGVAWKFAQALLPERSRDLLELAALGTIADVVPLLGENRAIVTFGLRGIAHSKRPGVAALCRTCRLAGNPALSSQDVAFRLVPHLNAAGRMDHPQPSLDLLLTQDEYQAEVLAQRLAQYNRERQSVTRKVMAEAEANLDTTLPFMFSANLDWGVGIVGLAAGRLAEQYGRPAIVVGGNGRHAVGSARAPLGSNVLELLRTAESFLMKLGGHERAAGFSLEPAQLEKFQQALAEASPQEKKERVLVREVQAELEPKLLNWDLLELLESFEPYGEGNKRPLFLVRGLSVLDVRLMGKEQEHLKLMLAGFGETLEAVGFRKAKQAPAVGSRVDIVGTVEVNEYRGNRRLQFVMEDVALAGAMRIEKLAVES